MSDFNISIISTILDKNNIESTNENCYLFLMFFLQRAQLISNLIKIINNKKDNTLSLGIKHLILGQSSWVKIQKRMQEFRKDFEKSDLINEILDFIKKTIENPNISINKEETSLIKKPEGKSLFFRTRLQSLILDFNTIQGALEQIENSLVLEENDLSIFLSGDDRLHVKDEIKKRLDREITKLELNWIKYKKNPKQNKEIYLLLKHWFNL